MKQRHAVYLHGFASGPSSQKARFFGEQLSAAGFSVHTPDLNEDDFRSLTLTRQLAAIDSLLHELGDDVLLFGSSMGGLLATLTAQARSGIRGLVLLAPGFGLSKRWKQLLGEEKLAQWKTDGVIEVFHHGENRNVELAYSFIDDAQRYETERLRIGLPALVFHGKADEVVPAQESIAFKDVNGPNVELHVLDSDHGLLDVLPHMWKVTEGWLASNGFVESTRAGSSGRD